MDLRDMNVEKTNYKLCEKIESDVTLSSYNFHSKICLQLTLTHCRCFDYFSMKPHHPKMTSWNLKAFSLVWQQMFQALFELLKICCLCQMLMEHWEMGRNAKTKKDDL